MLHKFILGSAFMAAIAVTVLFTSLAASSASPGGASPAAVDHYVPNYMLRWDSPMLPLAAPAPIPSR